MEDPERSYLMTTGSELADTEKAAGSVVNATQRTIPRRRRRDRLAVHERSCRTLVELERGPARQRGVGGQHLVPEPIRGRRRDLGEPDSRRDLERPHSRSTQTLDGRAAADGFT